MKEITIFSRIKVTFFYCLPAILACSLLAYLYCDRIQDIGDNIKISCPPENIHCVIDNYKYCEDFINQNKDSAQTDYKNSIKICEFRQKFFIDTNIVTIEDIEPDIATPQPPTETLQHEPAQIAEKAPLPKNLSFDNYSQKIRSTLANAHCDGQPLEKMLCEMNNVVDTNLFTIFLFNMISVSILVLLPYFLMGDLLSKSKRLHLNHNQRIERANANWWLKFLVALIMGVGLIYVINPLGRGASTYYQFFISVGLDIEKTLPIYIKAHENNEFMAPVIAGFLGWFLHLVGYIFTKLIYHDVISSRVYSLLFKKFIITYGIALVIPEVGFFAEGQSLAFAMFLIGLFPLSAMSMLIEAASKFGSSDKNMSGMLSQLPGISRWQILRLEEEGIDSMASLANIRPQTISENLQVIENLIHFWVDIAQLYTIVGQEAYDKMKLHCLTASAFLEKENDLEFLQSIRALEGVSEPHEIAHLLKRTFEGKLMS